MNATAYRKTPTRKSGRTICRLLGYLPGRTTISASPTLFIPGFIKPEAAWKRE